MHASNLALLLQNIHAYFQVSCITGHACSSKKVIFTPILSHVASHIVVESSVVTMMFN